MKCVYTLALLCTTLQVLFLGTTSAETKAVQLYGLNYSPRKGADWQPEEDRCKTTDEIKLDLQTLSTLTNRVRIYSLMDCDQGREVLSVASELGMKLWLGMWVSDNATVFEQETEVLESMLQNGYFDDGTVIGIHVGSEAIYREEISPAEAITNYESISTLLESYDQGSLPVTVTDIAHIYIANPLLKDAVDVVSANIFPFWDSLANVTTAVPEMIEYLKEEGVVDDSKDFIISETGWASEGSNGNAAEASAENQVEFFTSFYCNVAIAEPTWQYYYFTGIDNSWRAIQDETSDDVEGHFGIFDDTREMKPQFKSLEFTCPGDDTTVYSMTSGVVDDSSDDESAGSSTSAGNDESASESSTSSDAQSLGVSAILLLCHVSVAWFATL